MPVITVVPVVMPTGVQSVVGPVPAVGKIVAVVGVAVVVRIPDAVSRIVDLFYREAAATEKSCGPTPCGLIVCVTAVLSTVPAAVCHGDPQLRSWLMPTGI